MQGGVFRTLVLQRDPIAKCLGVAAYGRGFRRQCGHLGGLLWVENSLSHLSAFDPKWTVPAIVLSSATKSAFRA